MDENFSKMQYPKEKKIHFFKDSFRSLHAKNKRKLGFDVIDKIFLLKMVTGMPG